MRNYKFSIFIHLLPLLIILIITILFINFLTINFVHLLPLSIILMIIKYAQIKWRPVFWGLILQFVLGVLTLRWAVGRSVFQCISDKVATFLDFAKVGASFVFSENIVNNGVFAFAVS